jgi:PadR family transcriptional regulator AphA
MREPGGLDLYHGVMPDLSTPRLSLAEWVVLCVLSEGRSHGFALASLLGRDGNLGRIWRVPKPVIYRAIQRLELLGLARPAGMQPSAAGPVRSLSEATPAGRRLARSWLTRPVGHARDVRSELLIKLALLQRAGVSPQKLLRAQHEQLVPVAGAIDEQLREAEGLDRTIALWRHEMISATLRFLSAESQA